MMGLWKYYKQKMMGSNYRPCSFDETLDAFVKDAPEMREQVTWTMWLLDTEKPLPRVCHDWNATRSAMAAKIDEVKETYDKLIENPSEETAQTFSDSLDRIGPALDCAKSVLWRNRFQMEHTK